MLTGARRFVTSGSGGLIGSPVATRKMGTVSSRSRLFETDADASSGPLGNGAGAGGFSASSTVVNKNVSNGFLDGFIPRDDMYTRNRIFKDIYDHDPVSGGAVDVLSQVPFSDFVLKGIKDRTIMDSYWECCESLRLKIMLPSLSRDYLVMGKFIGSMFFDEDKKYFTAIMPQNAQYCLAGSTRVLTSLGEIAIKDLVKPNTPENAVTYIINEEEHIGTPAWSNGVQNIYELWLADGKCLKGTGSHEILVLFGSRKEWIPLDHIMPGDNIVLNNFNGTTKIPTSKVAAVYATGTEEVFDISVPGIKCFSANGIIVHNCEIMEMPIYGVDPLVNLKVPDNLRKFIAKGDPRIKNIMEQMPEDIKAFLKSGSVPLQPASTLYIPRRGLSSDFIGTSLYERILMLHLLEKTLVRGTVDMAQRRQRAIMHITVQGEGEDYIPSPADLESVKNLFAAADGDPTGAIIATRSGVSPNEVRSASDFWRSDESSDSITQQKMRALGISDALLSGDATYSTLDASMSIFVEQLKTYRGSLTREIFYDKIFPAIAAANDYMKTGFEVTGRVATEWDARQKQRDYRRKYALVSSDNAHDFKVGNSKLNTNDMVMPTISWIKTLAPVGDDQYLQMLSTLSDRGLPVPLTAFAAAGGLSLDEVFNGMNEELALRKELAKYNRKLEKYEVAAPQADDGQGGYEAQARLLEVLASRPSVRPKKHFLNREYPETADVHDVKKNGNFRHISQRGTKHLKEKQLKTLASVLANISKREAYNEKKNAPDNPKTTSHGPYGAYS